MDSVSPRVGMRELQVYRAGDKVGRTRAQQLWDVSAGAVAADFDAVGGKSFRSTRAKNDTSRHCCCEPSCVVLYHSDITIP